MAGTDHEPMLFPFSSQAALAGYAFRPYEDRLHGEHFDEAAVPDVLPSLSRAFRDLLKRRSR